MTDRKKDKRTDNTMTDVCPFVFFSVGHCIVCPFVFFSVGHCIVCPFVFFSVGHCIVCPLL
jgi:hypothetical protein